MFGTDSWEWEHFSTVKVEREKEKKKGWREVDCRWLLFPDSDVHQAAVSLE